MTQTIEQAKIPLSNAKRNLVILALMITSFVPFYATIARAVILPTVLSEFNAIQLYAIVLISASISMNMTVLVGGKIGDMFGRKNLIITGNIAYIFGCIITALSTNPIMLAFGLFITGLAYGSTSGSVKAMYAEICTPSETPKFQGYGATTDSAAALVAPVLGGIFAQSIGWQWVYWICIPLLIISSIIFTFILPKDKLENTSNKTIDVLGVIYFVLSLPLLLFLVATVDTLIPMFSPLFWGIIVVIVISAILLVRHENKVDNPAIALYLFKNKRFVLIFFICLLVYNTFVSTTYYTLFTQSVLGLDSAVSGYLLVPKGILGMVTATLVGTYLARYKRYKQVLTFELILIIISLGMFIIFSTETSNAMFLISTSLYGIGNAGIMTSCLILAQKSVNRKDLGASTSMIFFTSSLGMSIGNTLSGPILNIGWDNTHSLIPSSLSNILSSEHIEMITSGSILQRNDIIASIQNILTDIQLTDFNNLILNIRDITMNNIMILNAVCLAFAIIALVLIRKLKVD